MIEKLLDAIPVPDPEVADRWIGRTCIFILGYVACMLVYGL